MTMFANVPTLAAAGVPLRRPFAVLNVAQDGRFEIENVSGSLFASDAVGWNAYAVLIITVGAGVPLMTGGVFAGGGVCVRALTVIRNGPTARVSRPSLTVIV